VVLLHVCSLSWDDLLAVGMDRDEFFSRFDVLFTRFNSVTSHSNPAAIRLLRAGCGQPPHEALYRPAQDDCYLFDVFRQAGYRPSFALNHDGRYGGLRDEIERLGHAAGEVDVTGAPVRQIDFNGSVIRDDFSVLNAWWKARQRAGAQPALLYYNTITLHDGGHGVGEPEWWKRDRAQRYRESARALFHDLDEFMTILESSGRRSVVVFVPEHGLALRGSKLQPPGVREVPLPQITTVPVGIKLIGRGWHRGRETPRRIITQPTSYFALASWLAAVLHWDGLQDHGVTTRIAVPSTDFLAENEAARVVQHGSDYLVNGGSFGTRWVRLGADVLPETIGGAGHASTVHTIETEGGT
jgi:cellulose synthase operon protein YhjU